MLCSQCGAEVPAGDLFCESCGQRAGAETAAVCPCSVVDAEGFCEQCGRRVVRPASDHIEIVIGPRFAGVSDRGLRHDRNEDRFTIAQVGEDRSGTQIVVVCDGVSATRQSEIASAAVADTVLASLTKALQAGVTDAEAALRAAFAEANARVASLTTPGEPNSASTTAVAALVRGGRATIAWVGDSRAYWLVPGEPARLLTRDHSWVNEVIASGEVSPEQAARAPQAHAITRWIGADADGEMVPDVVQVAFEAPGLLLLCTDGLWNYAEPLDVLAQVVAEAGAASDEAVQVARRLVEFANRAGGLDNITVALLHAS